MGCVLNLVTSAQTHGKMGCLCELYFRLVPVLGRGGGGGGWMCFGGYNGIVSYSGDIEVK